MPMAEVEELVVMELVEEPIYLLVNGGEANAYPMAGIEVEVAATAEEGDVDPTERTVTVLQTTICAYLADLSSTLR